MYSYSGIRSIERTLSVFMRLRNFISTKTKLIISTSALLPQLTYCHNVRHFCGAPGLSEKQQNACESEPEEQCMTAIKLIHTHIVYVEHSPWGLFRANEIQSTKQLSSQLAGGQYNTIFSYLGQSMWPMMTSPREYFLLCKCTFHCRVTSHS